MFQFYKLLGASRKLACAIFTVTGRAAPAAPIHIHRSEYDPVQVGAAGRQLGIGRQGLGYGATSYCDPPRLSGADYLD
jgi:hypothetical protein